MCHIMCTIKKWIQSDLNDFFFHLVVELQLPTVGLVWIKHDESWKLMIEALSVLKRADGKTANFALVQQKCSDLASLQSRIEVEVCLFLMTGLKLLSGRSNLLQIDQFPRLHPSETITSYADDVGLFSRYLCFANWRQTLSSRLVKEMIYIFISFKYVITTSCVHQFTCLSVFSSLSFVSQPQKNSSGEIV